MYGNQFQSTQKLTQAANQIKNKRNLKPPLMSKSYSHFDINSEVSSPFSIYSKDHQQNTRKISEQIGSHQISDNQDLKYYIPNMSDRVHNHNPNIIGNYSLYKPNQDMQDKLIQFEKIKKNRFKKTSKNKRTPKRSSKNLVVSRTQSRTMTDEKYEGEGEYMGKYQSYKPVNDHRTIFSTQNSFQRKISSHFSDSKNDLKVLKTKDFYQMNTKEMKLIFSLLDSNNLGYINKNNSNFSAIPSNLMKKMKNLITTVISTDEKIDFETFLHLVYK
jgi:hypothetical protein